MLKGLFGASLRFAPVLLLKGNLADDLFPGMIPLSIPLLWDPEPTILLLAALPHLQNPLLN